MYGFPTFRLLPYGWVFCCIWLFKKCASFKDVILYGLMGLVIGVCVWFLPQITYVGRYPFWGNCLAFSRGHFTDWGGSVITFGGLGRVTCLVKSIWVYGLGGWWNDASFLRLTASLIMIASFLYSFKRYRFDRRGFFSGIVRNPLYDLGDSWTKCDESETYTAYHTSSFDADCVWIMQSL